jgi:hypothetical protein
MLVVIHKCVHHAAISKTVDMLSLRTRDAFVSSRTGILRHTVRSPSVVLLAELQRKKRHS